MAILDFLYFGEANVFQENLDSFLAIAEELKLKGLTGQTTSDVIEEKEKCENPKPTHKTKEPFQISTTHNSFRGAEEASRVIAVPSQFSGDLQALDEKVKSMMERSQNMIQNGKKWATALICKVCGKEGKRQNITDHIEANHLEGISIPCEYCDKAFGARQNLRQHKSNSHK